MYEIIGATEDQFGGQHLVVGCGDQLQTRIQINGEILKKFSTAITQMTPAPFLHYTRATLVGGKAFSNGMREREIHQQLLSWREKDTKQGP
jgi:hypothetical protein